MWMRWQGTEYTEVVQMVSDRPSLVSGQGSVRALPAPAVDGEWPLPPPSQRHPPERQSHNLVVRMCVRCITVPGSASASSRPSMAPRGRLPSLTDVSGGGSTSNPILFTTTRKA